MSAYLDDVYQGVISHLDELKGEIEQASVNYSSLRLFKCDLAILLLGLYEIRYREDVPNKVALNEAIEISKIYSTDKSGALSTASLPNSLSEALWQRELTERLWLNPSAHN